MKTKDATTGHTPGPWTFSQDGIWGPRQTIIANMGHTIHEPEASQIEANARLIAQAPKLKADRDTLLAAARDCHGSASWAAAMGNQPLADALYALRAAIAKAEAR